jgi:hypothetical protein
MMDKGIIEDDVRTVIIDEEKQIASFQVKDENGEWKETCKFMYFTEEQFEALIPDNANTPK